MVHFSDSSLAEERSRLNLNGSRQLSKSATELRNNDNSSPSRRGEQSADSGVVHHHRHHRHATSVAQRTHTFFATLKSRWARSRSKERKKSKDVGNVLSQGVESDYAADYSSEHSKSSSATQSPARHCLNHPESPLVRGGRQTVVTRPEDSPGRCSEAHSKASLSFQPSKDSNDEARGSISQDDSVYLQEEVVRRRELALRQHAFFQLRLHIRRGANLVAMDRCGASDPYVKVKSAGRLLHKSRTVHRDLNPVWDESVTLPIEDPFQPLTFKVFDYDWGLQDDFMGAAQLDLRQLDLGQPQDIVLELKDHNRPKQHLGEIFLTITLWPRNQQEKEQKHVAMETSETDSSGNIGKKQSSKIVDPEVVAVPRTGITFLRRDKVSDITESTIENSSSKSSSKFVRLAHNEEIHENKWKKFWDHHRDKFRHKSEDDISTKSRSFEEVATEVDALSRKAIKSIRFDRSENSDRLSSTEEGSREKGRNNSPEMSIEAPPRRSKLLLTARSKDRKYLEAMANDEGTFKKNLEGDIPTFVTIPRENKEKGEENASILCDVSESSFYVGISDKEKDRLHEKIRSDPSTRRWSSLENLHGKVEKVKEVSPRGRIDGLSIERPVRGKEKRTIGSLRSSLERKIGSVERILEYQIEKLCEENVEKHPWLLPIESWIAERRRHSGTYSVLQDKQNDDGREAEERKLVEKERAEPSFDFKFTAAENDEPRVECRLEHLKRPERFEGVNLISKLKRSEQSRAEDEESLLEMKDVKHHDLFDKLRDNVKEKMEDIHRYFQRTNRLADVNRRLKSQIWSSVVTIVLVEAKNLLPMDIDGLSDPYVKFRLGTEKYKSKVVHKTLNPVWLEQFDLHLYEDPYLGQELEVTVWDRDKSHQDDLMGKTVINLAVLERETTHRLWRDLEDGSGNIFLLLTISGTTANETISDLAAHEETPHEHIQLYQRYSLMNTLQRVRDVGHLTVKVFKAQGLAAADLGGKSDPFCVLELVNARLQTQTEYKTLAPSWQKIFTFNVKDINSVLEVTVYDEDRDHKVEFLGKVAIPLLKIRNGERRWYALKDKKLRGRAKGNSPQILLELNVVWNMVRACIRTLNPREKKYMEPELKFKRQVFLRNVLRLKAIIIIVIDIGKYVQSCWEWENKMRSIIALVIFIFGCYYFEPYMFPGAALLILLKYYLVAVLTGTPLSHHSSTHFHDEGDDGPATPGDDDDDEDDKDKEEKKSLKEKLQAIQEVTQIVQNSIGYIASLCERVKNLFNFTVPYLSYLAMILTILGVAVLYFVPLRYLILVWGVNKFFRKIIRPHSVPNNELLDLISRVPDDEELINYRELKPLPTADCEKASTSSSPGSSNMTRREQRKRHKAA
ncbi:Multiple C2 and transmembrane domain-containing protein 1 [Habropoda laboriosa]|uniref:Multiple C2 and transmembrane domain-containing protein 1 n=1 Tax=Habropoda laboriosa TaxID=597456 RepID=A0A0L7QX92_9HYME|nr:Multiple C2 and transmembrane domain-containing protein 1 [Habropoda laboriosa]